MRQNPPDPVGVQFAETETFGLALHHQPFRPQLGHQQRIALLNHYTTIHRSDEIANRLHRQGVGETELQDAGFRRRFAGVHDRHTGSNDAQRRATTLNDGLRTLFGIGSRPRQFVAQLAVCRTGIGRNHHPRRHITLEVWFFRRGRRGRLHHDAFRMAGARRHAQHHRLLELFRNGEGGTREIVGLL